MLTLEPIEGMTPEDLMQVRDRSFQEAYKVHDVGYDLLVKRLEAHGFEVRDHGDDARHVEGVYYGEGPDLEILHGGETVAYVEIKTKEDPEWFGRCNLRHFREYVNFSNEVDVPVFLWFALVDTETTTVHRDAFVEVEDTGQIDGEVYDVTTEEVVFYEEDVYDVNDDLLAVDGDDIVGVRNDQEIVEYIPDVWGNEVISLNESQFRSFPYFLHQLDSRSVAPQTATETTERPRNENITSITKIAEQAQQLLWERLQPNPSNPDIVQLRTAKGQMGQQIDAVSTLSLSIDNSGNVSVVVDGDTVELGNVLS